MLLEIVEAGHEALRRAARPVPVPVAGEDRAELAAFVDWMAETMRAAPGVGLAANQVARPVRVVVVEDRAEYHADVPPEVLAERERVPFDLQALVNPELSVIGDEVREWFEGCLSVPGYTAIVPRWRRVRLTATDVDGHAIEYEAVGWRARILQHEVDHLDGRLYVDRMLPRSFMTSESYVAGWNLASIPECKARLGIPDTGP
jgi:peptide deformylase